MPDNRDEFTKARHDSRERGLCVGCHGSGKHPFSGVRCSSCVGTGKLLTKPQRRVMELAQNVGKGNWVMVKGSELRVARNLERMGLLEVGDALERMELLGPGDPRYARAL